MTDLHTLHGRTGEKGGVIFWLFLGVAMFAALNMAFMNINRVGQPGDMTEADRLRATDIMQYANAVQRGLRVMKIEGVNDTSICFHTDQWGHNDYEYSPACDDPTNAVFDPRGGSISFSETVDDWFGNASASASINDENLWVFSGRLEVENVGTDGGAGTSQDDNTDLLMVTAPVKDNVCKAINEMLNYDPIIPSVTSGVHDSLANNKFAGDYTAGPNKIGDFGRERCLRDNEGFNFYYKVILAR